MTICVCFGYVIILFVLSLPFNAAAGMCIFMCILILDSLYRRLRTSMLKVFPKVATNTKGYAVTR